MHHRWIRLMAVVAALAACLAGAPAIAQDNATFVTEAATRNSFLTGFTRARTTLTLVSEESGRVEAVLADVGDTIGENGVFAQLDTTFIKLDLAATRADQERLRSDVSFYKKEMDRYRALVKNKTASQSTLDQHVRNHASAAQQLRALDIAEIRLEERLARFTIKAPAGWKVLTRGIDPGEWVTTGQQVAEIGRYDVLLVPYALTDSEYRALKAMGDTVPLFLEDEDLTVQARVLRVSPGFDPTTRKINVDLEIDQGDFEFRGGIRTELELRRPDPGGAVLVPDTALIKAYEEYFLLTPDKKRVKVVLLGSGPEGMTRVLSPDVRPGDVFLTNPVEEPLQ